ncbi:MAG: heavy metal-responsive transcriptional regulator [Gammaproteobacteria bacterium]|nr:heavy metal-responsive transcriptional regulator [Gammaproteobacteria bacterium]
MKRIGEVALALGLSVDTLRYYEKIGLVKNIQRNGSGVRCYQESDIARLRFVKRAQKIGFSLGEIASLLNFRGNPQKAKPLVRELALQKLTELEQHLKEITALRDELSQLVNLCNATPEGCPILDSFETD